MKSSRNRGGQNAPKGINWGVVGAYLLLGLLILGPAVGGGYILAFDMVFTPRMPPPSAINHLMPYTTLLWLLNSILPTWLLQKLLLLAILTGAGLGMHRLMPAPSTWAKYAAGLFYVINPFTYERLMAGQYLVLAGYALLPWLVAALLQMVRQPDWKNGLKLAAWLIAISVVSLHTMGFAIMLVLIAAGLGVWHWRQNKPRLARMAAAIGLALLVFVTASSYWLVPLVTHRSSQAALISGFDERHFLSFRTEGDPVIGVPGNVLALYGFWGEREGWYVSPKVAAPYWWVVGLALLALMAGGAIWGWRQKYRLILAFMLAALGLGWVLAQGIMGSPFAHFNHWLFDHLPFYRGYREPGKFVALVALAEALLLGLGVAAVHSWAVRRHPRSWLGQYGPGLLLMLPLLYTPNMAWGGAGQLRAVDYPRDWYNLNAQLANPASGGQVLFLPWHQYMYFDFADRVIANPAPRFFDRRTIAGDNPEIGLIERQTSSAQSEAIERSVVIAGADHTQAAERLARLDIEYVILSKTADYDRYAWLDKQPELQLVSDTATLKVFRNLKWRKAP